MLLLSLFTGLPAVMVLACCPVFAQSNSATLSGIVTDPSGAVVVGANVVATREATGVSQSTKTNRTGLYAFPELVPGSYNLAVTSQGFKQYVEQGLVLQTQDTVAQNVTLEIGAESQTVNVSSETALMNSQNATVSTVVDRQTVANMPLNGRSFQGLITLSPGVATVATGLLTPGQFVVNGQRSDTNSFTVDGVSANVASPLTSSLNTNGTGSTPTNSATGGFNGMVSVDALQEFRINTSSFAPEFGRSPGGQISLTSRGGTNDFHGDVFDYFRNTVLDANDWFLNAAGQPRGVVRQNDFGGVVGGRIIKDRLFYFVSYEGLRLQSPSPAVVVVPTQAARTLAAAANDNGVVGYMAQFLNAFPLPDGNPATPCVSDATCSANYTAVLPGTSILDSISVRVDYSVNKRMTLFGRYSHSPSSLSTASTVTTTALQEGNDVYTAGWTYAINNTITNDLHFNFTHTTLLKSQNPLSYTGSLSTIFPPGFAQPPSIYAPQTMSINFSLFPGSDAFVSAPAAANHGNDQRSIADTISLVKGSHELKLGGDFRALYPSFDQSNFSWNTAFNQVTAVARVTANVCPSNVLPAGAGTTVSGLICGRATLSNIQHNVPRHFLFREYSFFGQDTWKATKRLTVTYGARWDIDPAVEWTNGFPGFSVNQNSFNLSDLTGVTLNPLGTPTFQTRWGNVAPRLGLAYQLSADPKRGRVVRAGYGVFYDTGNQVFAIATSPFNSRLNNIGAGGGAPVGILQFPLTIANATYVTPVIIPNPPPFPIALGSDNLVDPNFKVPFIHEMNLTLEQQLGSNQTVSIAYVGALGRHLIGDLIYPPKETNPAVLGNGTVGDTLNLFGNYSGSSYHALQVKVQRRFSQGMGFIASYTWSHSIDNGSVNGPPPSQAALPTAARLSTNLPVAGIRGSSDFDVRQILALSLVYDIPTPFAGNTVFSAILGHWSADPIYHYQGAPPLDILAGVQSPLGGVVFNQRPNLIPGIPIYVSGSDCARQYAADQGFNICAGGRALNNAPVSATAAATVGCLSPTARNARGAFCTPAPIGTQAVSGNFGRNIVRGLPLQELDLSIHREFPFHENIRLRFQADAFNLFNHPSFGPETTTMNTPTFGETTSMANSSLGLNAGSGSGFNPIFSTGGPRNFQFALKLFF